MRIVVQRVTRSHVCVDSEVVGSIGKGLNLLIGIASTDTETETDWMVRKCLQLRLFDGEKAKRWQKSIQEIGGEILVISQFTLYGDCRKGRRPSFDASAVTLAEDSYNYFVARLRQSNLKVETGRFGANMQVSIENDGPVTLLLEREAN